MQDSIIIPEVLEQSARDYLFRLGVLGEVYLTPGIPHTIQDGEHLIYNWDDRDTVTYFREGQGRGPEDTPRLQFEHIHVPAYGAISRQPLELVGEPLHETRLSIGVDLFPGDSAPLSITEGFTDSLSEVEAIKEGITAAAKIHLGETVVPVGVELTSQVTKELTHQNTDSKTRSETILTGETVVNHTDAPVRVHLQAERTTQRVRQNCMIDAELDYVIRWVPWQPGYSQRVEGVQSAVWDSVEQFYSSMAGQEPSHIGSYGGKRGRSLSEVARGNPQSRPPKRVVKMPFVAEYDNEIYFNVTQVRVPLGGNGGAENGG